MQTCLLFAVTFFLKDSKINSTYFLVPICGFEEFILHSKLSKKCIDDFFLWIKDAGLYNFDDEIQYLPHKKIE